MFCACLTLLASMSSGVRGKDPAWDVRIVAMSALFLMVVLFVCVSDAVAVNAEAASFFFRQSHSQSCMCDRCHVRSRGRE